MTGDEFKRLMDEDRSFLIADCVTVFWTNSGRYLRGKGKITKINEKTIRVRLEEHVATEHFGGYPVGQVIIAPRIMNIDRWSMNNCVRALPSPAATKVEA